MGFEVALLAGFYEGPFYYHVRKGAGTNWSVEEAAEHLRLGPDLVADLIAWDNEYQAILDRSYPPDSKFPTPEAQRAWIERGKELAARIKRESPLVASVDYQADGCYKDGTCVF
ncbi:hypothetical protein [Actinoalloteichus fjordicus]|uniref:Uncharacterized protein n=1 Tax=Actinoalloteichus fjordicus TaxID=1612552 RepID=A0AAC9L9B0_9PSEU|nr:hypothetical protein [Actinoalloteichus fjordicus]APU13558.1 hypothetical protein UA74_07445 [Actinoalloteichus fjordicus]